MYVFRDGRRAVSGPGMVRSLAKRLQTFPFPFAQVLDVSCRDALIDLLLRSGELECALTDVGSAAAHRLARLTDLLALLLVGAACAAPDPAEMLALLPHETPEILYLSPPEGFAFYALHPLDFADIAACVPLRGAYVAVVGIRSIGVTLSAVVRAALTKRGVHAERITVRPTGHPYDRHTEFSADQLRWIAAQRADEADFLVVDEGPGMSGSSFLSVGDALLGAGAERFRVRFLCSRAPDVTTLCARDAAARWASYQASYSAPATHLPTEARIYIGGGYWRHELIGYDPALWPASWSQMERLKFLSTDRRVLFKFEGFGRFGAEIRERALALSEAGYIQANSSAFDGFGAYSLVDGQILNASHLGREVLERMAEYCAFRAHAFRSNELHSADELESMVRFNVAEEFGVELNGELGSLQAEQPVLVDGRMLPHEWVRGRDGRLLKCDGCSHGDDHFFPGPAADICWDLAGTIIEWDLSPQAKQCLLQRYTVLTRDDPRHRLPAYMLAYSVFRMAYCKMAAAAMRMSEEEIRLQCAYERYRKRAEILLNVAGFDAQMQGAVQE
jgi:hypothetical protein